MSRETIYMVQSFHLANHNHIRADAPIACKSALSATRAPGIEDARRDGVFALHN